MSRFQNSSAGRIALLAIAATAAFSTSALIATAQAQNSTDAAYDKVAGAWASMKTLRADFEQTITNPLVARTVRSKGVFLQERPAKVSITFTDPAGDRIVGDGRWLWVYLPSSAPGQVLKLPANSDGAVVADLLSQLLDTPRKSFTLTGGSLESVNNRQARMVELTPKNSAAVPFRKATLWLDTQQPRPLKIRVVDAQGVDRTITLTTWSPNATLPRDAFSFAVPKGAKVSGSPAQSNGDW